MRKFNSFFLTMVALKYTLVCVVLLIIQYNALHAQQSLTLQQAIDAALQQNLQIAIARNDSTVATNNNHAGNAGMLPNVSLNVNENPALLNLNQRFTNGSEINRSNVFSHSFSPSLALSYTLYDGGKMFATRERLEQLQALGESALRTTIQNVLNNTVKAYYQAYSQVEYLKVLTQLLKNSQSRLDIMLVRKEAGAASDADVTFARLDLEARQQAIRMQEVAIAQAFADLNQWLNEPAELRYVLTLEDSEKGLLQKDLLLQQFEKNPEFISAEQKIKVALAMERESKASMYPKVGITAAYGYTLAQSQAGFSLYNQTYGPTAGLAVSIPLFTGHVNQRNYENAQVQSKTAALQAELTKDALQIAFEKAWQMYTAMTDQVVADDASKKLAEAYLRISEDRFKSGQITVLDYREAQRTYEETMYRSISNKLALKLAEADLKRLTGAYLN